MSSLFDSLSEEIFQILKGSGKTLTLFKSDGNRTYEPKEARRVFATPDNIMVSVSEAGSDSEVKLYLSQSTDVRAISKLINTLRQVTTRYNVLFNVRKFGSELKPKDFAFQATVAEASMWGTTKTSYQKFGPTKLIVKHTMPVREGIIGARGRNILSMFVETVEGERFKFPAIHLSAGRAFAQHINQGGKPHDAIGSRIVELAQESLQLARVNRYIHHARNILDEDASALRTPIKNRIVELRKAFVGLARPRGYHKIKEAGLPLNTANLLESDDGVTGEISRLSELLKIDSNHALAESLMPVALLTLGENMTDITEMFHGVITLEDATADALIETLVDDFGYTDDSWTRFGSNVAFAEEALFNEAKMFLDSVNEAYAINENDAIVDYATQWSKARYARSGEQGAMDKDQLKGIDDLADGIRQILSGNLQMPDYPEIAPTFSRTDPTVKDRFYLDLYVSQHKLANVATLNYVSSIVDKMAEGKPLDSAEKTIKTKLVQALEDDLGESIVDEGYYDDDPHYDRNTAAIERTVEEFEETFDAANFLNTQGYEEFLDDTVGPEDKADPMEASYFVGGIAHMLNQALEDADLVGYEESHVVQVTAKELFDSKVKPLLIQNGWHISESVVEFAVEDDKPSHHGFSAGDHVATDKGPAEVISIEGDIASISYLHGGTDTIHVDDMDKVPALSNVAEEAELAEWFNSFSPEAILEYTGPTLEIGDRVTHKTYRSGEVVANDGKFVKVKFDEPHARLPDHKAILVQPGTLTKAGSARLPEEELTELSKDKVADYFNRAAGDRSRAEKKAVKTGDDSRLTRRDRGLQMAWNKMKQEDVENIEEARKPLTLTTYIEWNGEEDVEVEVEYSISDGSFATGLDYPSTHSYGPEVDIDSVVVKATGEDIGNELSRDQLEGIQQACIDDSTNRDDGRGDYEYERYRDRQLESDEVLGGDMGQDLIDDVKVGRDAADVGESAELDADIHDGMSDEELFHAYKNAWKGRGTLQALNRMDKIKGILAKREKTIDDLEEAAELDAVLKNAFFRK